MTVGQLIELLNKVPNKSVNVFVYSREDECSGEILDIEIKDIIEPSNNKEVYIRVIY